MLNSQRLVLANACLMVALIACPALAADKRVNIVVEAGDVDRTNQPVLIDLPPALRDVKRMRVTVADPKGRPRATPAQVVKGVNGQPDRLCVLLPATLKAGKSLRLSVFEIKTDAKPHVRATDDGKHLLVSVGDRKVLRYNHAVIKAPEGVTSLHDRSGHIHPIWSPSQKVVSNDFPKKHLHHHGLWFVWRDTEFEGKQTNFWEQREGQGDTKFVKFESVTSGDVFAQFTARQVHIALKAEGGPKPALNETWTVRVYNTSPYSMFDFESVQTCSTSSPLTVLKKYYGGFGYRGSGEWEGDAVTFLTASGKDKKAGNFTNDRWCAMFGQVDGKTCGVAFLSHPSNFRHPQPMRLHPKEPFFCFAPGQNAPFKIEPGKPYASRYRVVVFDGEADAKLLEKLWRDYANAAKMRVEK